MKPQLVSLFLLSAALFISPVSTQVSKYNVLFIAADDMNDRISFWQKPASNTHINFWRHVLNGKMSPSLLINFARIQ